METKMLKLACRLFNSEFVPESVNRSNRIKWIKSIRILGDKWQLNQFQEKCGDSSASSASILARR